MSSVSDYTSYSNASKRAQESYDSEKAQARSNHEREIDNLKESQEEQIARSREDSNERIQQVRSEANDEIRKLKEEMYDSKGKKISQDSRDINEERAQLNQFRDQINKESDRRIEQAERASASKGVQSAKNEERKVNEAVSAQKKSHLEEINRLQEELDTYRSQPRDVEHEKALARGEVVEKYEGETIHDRDRIIEAYEGRISRMKENEAQKENFFTRRVRDTVNEQNDRTKTQLNTQKNEFTKAQLDRNAENARMEKYYQGQVKREQDRNVRSEGTLVASNQEKTNQALSSKDQTYQNYLKQSGTSHNQELSARDEKIKDLRTTDDPLKVSPFVVQKINDRAEKRNFEALTQEQKSNEANLAAARKRDHEERSELRDNFDQQQVSMSRDIQRQRDLEKKQFNSGFQDLQESKMREQMKLSELNTDQRQRMSLKHSEDMNLQARKFQDDMTVQRDSSQDDKIRLQEDLEGRNKTENREWFTKLNTLQRSFETKLTDAQDQNDRLVKDLTYSFDKKLRDQDRLSKKAMEDRVKAYEHQIAQQAATFKERERFLKEQSQEELDTLKRTNARIIQTKS